MREINLAVDKVTVTYGANNLRVQALKGVSLEFISGELTLVMGPSGSGKTTLLSLLGCLLTPDLGSVTVHGTEVARLRDAARTRLRRQHIGFIFQAFRLFHSLTAFENVMIASDLAGRRTPTKATSARMMLESLGLGDKVHSKPNALSGGEKQRVAIARALFTSPTIVLADEPTASLDAAAGRQICQILRGLADEQRTVVVVSHDPRWTEFAHRTVVLEDGRVMKDWSNN